MNKTFKIVQTKVNDVLSLSVVPANWEKNGKLFWPPSAIENVAFDNAAMPVTKEWTEYDCMLKCKNIKTYNEAIEKLSKLTEKSDTDTSINTRPRRQLQNAVYNGDKSRVDYNSEFVRITSELFSEIKAEKIYIYLQIYVLVENAADEYCVSSHTRNGHCAIGHTTCAIHFEQSNGIGVHCATTAIHGISEQSKPNGE